MLLVISIFLEDDSELHNIKERKSTSRQCRNNININPVLLTLSTLERAQIQMS